MASESPCSFAGVQPPCATGTAAAVWWKIVGMTRAMAASVRAVAETPAATRLNSCLRNLRPPERNERPRTSRTLPMIEPVMEALTTPVSPFERAKSPMMSSAALPNVALRSPPTPCPRCSARCSVARPIHLARGTIARHDTTKSAVGFSSDGKYLRAMATGTNTRSQSSRGLSQERRRGAWAAGCPASDGPEGDVMSSIYHTCLGALSRRTRNEAVARKQRRPGCCACYESTSRCPSPIGANLPRPAALARGSAVDDLERHGDDHGSDRWELVDVQQSRLSKRSEICNLRPVDPYSAGSRTLFRTP